MKLIERESFGEALHVALRKVCDSAPTSAAWNCVHLMPNSVWGEYLDAAWPWITGKSKAKEVWQRLKAGSAAFDRERISMDDVAASKLIRTLPEKETAGRSPSEILAERAQWAVLFSCILRTFDDTDWRNFASYLTDEG